MIAQFSSRCSVCDEAIDEGDVIVRDADDNGWCHVGCDDG
jgi:hypothetical protein